MIFPSRPRLGRIGPKYAANELAFNLFADPRTRNIGETARVAGIVADEAIAKVEDNHGNSSRFRGLLAKMVWPGADAFKDGLRLMAAVSVLDCGKPNRTRLRYLEPERMVRPPRVR